MGHNLWLERNWPTKNPVQEPENLTKTNRMLTPPRYATNRTTSRSRISWQEIFFAGQHQTLGFPFSKRLRGDIFKSMYWDSVNSIE